MDLQQRFVAGDLEAFEQLFRDYQRQVYAWIVRIVRDSATAEDLTVETFWRIYRSRTLFRPDGNFGAWSRRIATPTSRSTISVNRAAKPNCPTICSRRPRPIPPSPAKCVHASAPRSRICRRNIASSPRSP